jgi:pimeloyl-ACP methyl ester carboxylesterase
MERSRPWRLTANDASQLLTNFATSPAYLETVRAAMFDVPRGLDQITCPVLLLQGTADRFSNAEALISATSLAARACGVADRKSRLLPGYDEDLLAVAGHPLADLHALLDVQAVFCSGRRVTQPNE